MAKRQEHLKKFSTMELTYDDLSRYQDLPKRLQLVMLGKTGSGKSSTANTIMDKNRFPKAFGFKSCTSKVDLEHVEFKPFTFDIMDTPGLFDTRKNGLTNENILLEITKTAINFPQGVHAFIMVFSCSGRFTEEDEKTMAAIEKQFGQKFYDHCLLLFTRSAEYADADMTLKDVLAESDYLSKLLGKVKGRAIGIENMHTDDIDKELQRQFIFNAIAEVAHGNGGAPYSGKLFKVAKEEMEKDKERRQNLAAIRQLPVDLISEFVSADPNAPKGKHSITEISKRSLVEAIKSKQFSYVSEKDINDIVNKFFKDNTGFVEKMREAHKNHVETDKIKSELQSQLKKQRNNEELHKAIQEIVDDEMNSYLNGQDKSDLCSTVSSLSMGDVPSDLRSLVFRRLPPTLRSPDGEHDKEFNEILLEILRDKQKMMMSIIGNHSKIFSFLLGDIWAPLLSGVVSRFFPARGSAPGDSGKK